MADDPGFCRFISESGHPQAQHAVGLLASAGDGQLVDVAFMDDSDIMAVADGDQKVHDVIVDMRVAANSLKDGWARITVMKACFTKACASSDEPHPPAVRGGPRSARTLSRAMIAFIRRNLSVDPHVRRCYLRGDRRAGSLCRVAVLRKWNAHLTRSMASL